MDLQLIQNDEIKKYGRFNFLNINRISACVFYHRVPQAEVFPLKHRNSIKICGKMTKYGAGKDALRCLSWERGGEHYCARWIPLLLVSSTSSVSNSKMVHQSTLQ